MKSSINLSRFYIFVLLTGLSLCAKSRRDLEASMDKYLEQVGNDIREKVISVLPACTVVVPNTKNFYSSGFASVFLHNLAGTAALLTQGEPRQLLSRTIRSASLLASLRFVSALKVVVTVFPEQTTFQNFVTGLNSQLTTVTAITRRDEDYYCFIATDQKVVSPFLNSRTSKLIRFQAIYHPISKNGFSSPHFSMIIPCIYCTVSVSSSYPALDRNRGREIENHLFLDPTINLHGMAIRISAPPIQYLPTYEMEFKSGQYRHKRGVHTLIFSAVADKINATYTLVPCRKFGGIREGATGVLLPDGTWAGCMGDVIRDLSDMALSVSPDDRRYDHVHFSSALEYSPVTFTTAKPKLYSSWKSIFTALEGAVWGFIVMSIMLAACALHATDFSIQSCLVVAKRWIESCFHLVAYIIGQSLSSKFVSSLTTKIIHSFWLFYGFLIGATYLCSLQAIVVSPRLSVIPKTFSQLVNSHYRLGAASGFRSGLGEQIFKNSDNPIMREVYHKMQVDKDEIECTTKTLFSQYACLNWEIIEKFHLITEFADKSGNHPFQASDETAFFTSLNFIFRKRELYRSHFNDFITRAYDTGLVKQMIAMDWREFRFAKASSRKNYDKYRESNGPKAFVFENVKGSFILLLCGLIGGFLMFASETWANIFLWVSRLKN